MQLGLSAETIEMIEQRLGRRAANFALVGFIVSITFVPVITLCLLVWGLWSWSVDQLNASAVRAVWPFIFLAIVYIVVLRFFGPIMSFLFEKRLEQWAEGSPAAQKARAQADELLGTIESGMAALETLKTEVVEDVANLKRLDEKVGSQLDRAESMFADLEIETANLQAQLAEVERTRNDD